MDYKLPVQDNGTDYVITMAGIRQVEREIERLQAVCEAARALSEAVNEVRHIEQQPDFKMDGEQWNSAYDAMLWANKALKDALVKAGKGE